MNRKLTLRLDDNLISSAKEYSAKTGRSISRIVANLFEIIENEKLRKLKREEKQLSPTVKSLRGILKGKIIAEKDYKKHLEEKYL